jgi:hypothetical protein
MTMQYPVPDQSKINEVLYNSPADWISPGFDDELLTGRWFTDPPANDGRKVVISDTDHYAPGAGDALWAWKSFLRGHHPILMDFGIINVMNPLDPSLGVPSYESFEAARYAMGDTLRYAGRMKLIDMKPRGELSSTGYALANPGEEYLILQPDEGGGAFTVRLEAGVYQVEWYSVARRETRGGGEVEVESEGKVSVKAPFDGAAVVYLKR